MQPIVITVSHVGYVSQQVTLQPLNTVQNVLEETYRNIEIDSFLPRFAPEILACEADSVVGAAVLDLFGRVIDVLSMSDGNGVLLESDFIHSVLSAFEVQINTWYFG